MDYEKKYKEALGRAMKLYEQGTITESLGHIFPELVEPEGERIRKELYIYLDWLDGRKGYAPKGEYTIRDMIAWIEKQGGVRSIEFDEHDEMYINALIAIVRKRGATDERLRDELIGWLDYLKGRLGG